MRFEAGDKLKILNAYELNCLNYWNNGTIVEIFAINKMDGTLFVYNPEDHSSVTHEIYFDEYGFVELIKNKGSGSMEFKKGDLVEFIDVEKINGDAKKYFKNGDTGKVYESFYGGIKIFTAEESIYNYIMIYNYQFPHIKLVKDDDVHRDSLNLINKVMDEFDKETLQLRIDYLLDHRKFDELKALTDELNKRSEGDE